MNLIPQVTPAQLSIVRGKGPFSTSARRRTSLAAKSSRAPRIPLGQLPLRLDEWEPLARAGYHPILADGLYDDPEIGAAAVGLHTSPSPVHPPREEHASHV